MVYYFKQLVGVVVFAKVQGPKGSRASVDTTAPTTNSLQ
jgi:hypothetical protein